MDGFGFFAEHFAYGAFSGSRRADENIDVSHGNAFWCYFLYLWLIVESVPFNWHGLLFTFFRFAGAGNNDFSFSDFKQGDVEVGL
ncbi:MAG: hypothetical protein J6T06_11260, partial [Victivallales bacterium]|nr:hypothetical protein [Victivallales bacterium]